MNKIHIFFFMIIVFSSITFMMFLQKTLCTNTIMKKSGKNGLNLKNEFMNKKPFYNDTYFNEANIYNNLKINPFHDELLNKKYVSTANINRLTIINEVPQEVNLSLSDGKDKYRENKIIEKEYKHSLVNLRKIEVPIIINQKNLSSNKYKKVNEKEKNNLNDLNEEKNSKKPETTSFIMNKSKKSSKLKIMSTLETRSKPYEDFLYKNENNIDNYTIVPVLDQLITNKNFSSNIKSSYDTASIYTEEKDTNITENSNFNYELIANNNSTKITQFKKNINEMKIENSIVNTNTEESNMNFHENSNYNFKMVDKENNTYIVHEEKEVDEIEMRNSKSNINAKATENYSLVNEYLNLEMTQIDDMTNIVMKKKDIYQMETMILKLNNNTELNDSHIIQNESLNNEEYDINNKKAIKTMQIKENETKIIRNKHPNLEIEDNKNNRNILQNQLESDETKAKTSTLHYNTKNHNLNIDVNRHLNFEIDNNDNNTNIMKDEKDINEMGTKNSILNIEISDIEHEIFHLDNNKNIKKDVDEIETKDFILSSNTEKNKMIIIGNRYSNLEKADNDNILNIKITGNSNTKSIETIYTKENNNNIFENSNLDHEIAGDDNKTNIMNKKIYSNEIETEILRSNFSTEEKDLITIENSHLDLDIVDNGKTANIETIYTDKNDTNIFGNRQLNNQIAESEHKTNTLKNKKDFIEITTKSLKPNISSEKNKFNAIGNSYSDIEIGYTDNETKIIKNEKYSNDIEPKIRNSFINTELTDKNSFENEKTNLEIAVNDNQTNIMRSEEEIEENKTNNLITNTNISENNMNVFENSKLNIIKTDYSSNKNIRNNEKENDEIMRKGLIYKITTEKNNITFYTNSYLNYKIKDDDNDVKTINNGKNSYEMLTKNPIAKNEIKLSSEFIVGNKLLNHEIGDNENKTNIMINKKYSDEIETKSLINHIFTEENNLNDTENLNFYISEFENFTSLKNMYLNENVTDLFEKSNLNTEIENLDKNKNIINLEKYIFENETNILHAKKNNNTNSIEGEKFGNKMETKNLTMNNTNVNDINVIDSSRLRFVTSEYDNNMNNEKDNDELKTKSSESKINTNKKGSNIAENKLLTFEIANNDNYTDIMSDKKDSDAIDTKKLISNISISKNNMSFTVNDNLNLEIVDSGDNKNIIDNEKEIGKILKHNINADPKTLIPNSGITIHTNKTGINNEKAYARSENAEMQYENSNKADSSIKYTNVSILTRKNGSSFLHTDESLTNNSSFLRIGRAGSMLGEISELQKVDLLYQYRPKCGYYSHKHIIECQFNDKHFILQVCENEKYNPIIDRKEEKHLNVINKYTYDYNKPSAGTIFYNNEHFTIYYDSDFILNLADIKKLMVFIDIGEKIGNDNFNINNLDFIKKYLVDLNNFLQVNADPMIKLFNVNFTKKNINVIYMSAQRFKVVPKLLLKIERAEKNNLKIIVRLVRELDCIKK